MSTTQQSSTNDDNDRKQQEERHYRRRHHHSHRFTRDPPDRPPAPPDPPTIRRRRHNTDDLPWSPLVPPPLEEIEVTIHSSDDDSATQQTFDGTLQYADDDDDDAFDQCFVDNHVATADLLHSILSWDAIGGGGGNNHYDDVHNDDDDVVEQLLQSQKDGKESQRPLATTSPPLSPLSLSSAGELFATIQKVLSSDPHDDHGSIVQRLFGSRGGGGGGGNGAAKAATASTTAASPPKHTAEPASPTSDSAALIMIEASQPPLLSPLSLPSTAVPSSTTSRRAAVHKALEALRDAQFALQQKPPDADDGHNQPLLSPTLSSPRPSPPPAASMTKTRTPAPEPPASPAAAAAAAAAAVASLKSPREPSPTALPTVATNVSERAVTAPKPYRQSSVRRRQSRRRRREKTRAHDDNEDSDNDDSIGNIAIDPSVPAAASVTTPSDNAAIIDLTDRDEPVRRAPILPGEQVQQAPHERPRPEQLHRSASTPRRRERLVPQQKSDSDKENGAAATTADLAAATRPVVVSTLDALSVPSLTLLSSSPSPGVVVHAAACHHDGALTSPLPVQRPFLDHSPAKAVLPFIRGEPVGITSSPTSIALSPALEGIFVYRRHAPQHEFRREPEDAAADPRMVVPHHSMVDNDDDNNDANVAPPRSLIPQPILVPSRLEPQASLLSPTRATLDPPPTANGKPANVATAELKDNDASSMEHPRSKPNAGNVDAPSSPYSFTQWIQSMTSWNNDVGGADKYQMPPDPSTSLNQISISPSVPPASPTPIPVVQLVDSVRVQHDAIEILPHGLSRNAPSSFSSGQDGDDEHEGSVSGEIASNESEETENAAKLVTVTADQYVDLSSNPVECAPTMQRGVPQAPIKAPSIRLVNSTQIPVVAAYGSFQYQHHASNSVAQSQALAPDPIPRRPLQNGTAGVSQSKNTVQFYSTRQHNVASTEDEFRSANVMSYIEQQAHNVTAMSAQVNLARQHVRSMQTDLGTLTPQSAIGKQCSMAPWTYGFADAVKKSVGARPSPNVLECQERVACVDSWPEVPNQNQRNTSLISFESVSDCSDGSGIHSAETEKRPAPGRHDGRGVVRLQHTSPESAILTLDTLISADTELPIQQTLHPPKLSNKTLKVKAVSSSATNKLSLTCTSLIDPPPLTNKFESTGMQHHAMEPRDSNFGYKTFTGGARGTNSTEIVNRDVSMSVRVKSAYENSRLDTAFPFPSPANEESTEKSLTDVHHSTNRPDWQEQCPRQHRFVNTNLRSPPFATPNPPRESLIGNPPPADETKGSGISVYRNHGPTSPIVSQLRESVRKAQANLTSRMSSLQRCSGENRYSSPSRHRGAPVLSEAEFEANMLSKCQGTVGNGTFFFKPAITIYNGPVNSPLRQLDDCRTDDNVRCLPPPTLSENTRAQPEIINLEDVFESTPPTSPKGKTNSAEVHTAAKPATACPNDTVNLTSDDDSLKSELQDLLISEKILRQELDLAQRRTALRRELLLHSRANDISIETSTDFSRMLESTTDSPWLDEPEEIVFEASEGNTAEEMPEGKVENNGRVDDDDDAVDKAAPLSPNIVTTIESFSPNPARSGKALGPRDHCTRSGRRVQPEGVEIAVKWQSKHVVRSPESTAATESTDILSPFFSDHESLTFRQRWPSPRWLYKADDETTERNAFEESVQDSLYTILHYPGKDDVEIWLDDRLDDACQLEEIEVVYTEENDTSTVHSAFGAAQDTYRCTMPKDPAYRTEKSRMQRPSTQNRKQERRAHRTRPSRSSSGRPLQRVGRYRPKTWASCEEDCPPSRLVNIASSDVDSTLTKPDPVLTFRAEHESDSQASPSSQPSSASSRGHNKAPSSNSPSSSLSEDKIGTSVASVDVEQIPGARNAAALLVKMTDLADESMSMPLYLSPPSMSSHKSVESLDLIENATTGSGSKSNHREVEKRSSAVVLQFPPRIHATVQPPNQLSVNSSLDKVVDKNIHILLSTVDPPGVSSSDHPGLLKFDEFKSPTDILSWAHRVSSQSNLLLPTLATPQIIDAVQAAGDPILNFFSLSKSAATASSEFAFDDISSVSAGKSLSVGAPNLSLDLLKDEYLNIVHNNEQASPQACEHSTGGAEEENVKDGTSQRAQSCHINSEREKISNGSCRNQPDATSNQQKCDDKSVGSRTTLTIQIPPGYQLKQTASDSDDTTFLASLSESLARRLTKLRVPVNDDKVAQTLLVAMPEGFQLVPDGSIKLTRKPTPGVITVVVPGASVANSVSSMSGTSRRVAASSPAIAGTDGSTLAENDVAHSTGRTIRQSPRSEKVEELLRRGRQLVSPKSTLSNEDSIVADTKKCTSFDQTKLDSARIAPPPLQQSSQVDSDRSLVSEESMLQTCPTEQSEDVHPVAKPNVAKELFPNELFLDVRKTPFPTSLAQSRTTIPGPQRITAQKFLVLHHDHKKPPLPQKSPTINRLERVKQIRATSPRVVRHERHKFVPEPVITQPPPQEHKRKSKFPAARQRVLRLWKPDKNSYKPTMMEPKMPAHGGVFDLPSNMFPSFDMMSDEDVESAPSFEADIRRRIQDLEQSLQYGDAASASSQASPPLHALMPPPVSLVTSATLFPDLLPATATPPVTRNPQLTTPLIDGNVKSSCSVLSSDDSFPSNHGAIVTLPAAVKDAFDNKVPPPTQQQRPTKLRMPSSPRCQTAALPGSLLWNAVHGDKKR